MKQHTSYWPDDVMKQSNRTLVLNHLNHGWPANSWQDRHLAAQQSPRAGTERGLLSLLLGFADLCDGYLESTQGDRTLGQDGYFHEHARQLVEALLAYLNFDIGRFDAGTLDGLIRQLAERNGVTLD